MNYWRWSPQNKPYMSGSTATRHFYPHRPFHNTFPSDRSIQSTHGGFLSALKRSWPRSSQMLPLLIHVCCLKNKLPEVRHLLSSICNRCHMSHMQPLAHNTNTSVVTCYTIAAVVTYYLYSTIAICHVCNRCHVSSMQSLSRVTCAEVTSKIQSRHNHRFECSLQSSTLFAGCYCCTSNCYISATTAATNNSSNKQQQQQTTAATRATRRT